MKMELRIVDEFSTTIIKLYEHDSNYFVDYSSQSGEIVHIMVQKFLNRKCGIRSKVYSHCRRDLPQLCK